MPRYGVCLAIKVTQSPSLTQISWDEVDYLLRNSAKISLRRADNTRGRNSHVESRRAGVLSGMTGNQIRLDSDACPATPERCQSLNGKMNTRLMGLR